MGRNPKYFPNADEFLPERFLEDEVTDRSKFSYLPFSAGGRNCKYAIVGGNGAVIYRIFNFRHWKKICNFGNENISFESFKTF